MSEHVVIQTIPLSDTLTPLYTVPALKRLTARVLITNRDVLDAAFRVATAPAGAADDPSQYIAYDEALAGASSVSSVPIMLAAGDVVRVRASNADTAFTLNGLLTDA